MPLVLLYNNATTHLVQLASRHRIVMFALGYDETNVVDKIIWSSTGLIVAALLLVRTLGSFSF